MRRMWLGALLMVCLVQPALSQTLTSASFGVLKYFPGDVVHLVVEGPPDMVSITALMPDGEHLNLSFSRRTQIWHNYWEVPAGFKKGGYTAKLRAADVEGRIFEGESELFYVGEPTLPMVMHIEPSREGRFVRRSVPEKEIEKKKETKKREEIGIKKEIATKKAIAPKLQKPQKPLKPQRPKIVPKKAKRPAIKAEPNRLQLIVEAREYYFKHDYGKLKNRLDALMKIDPDNDEIRALRKRIAE